MNAVAYGELNEADAAFRISSMCAAEGIDCPSLCNSGERTS